jgi:hypothetical protein
MRQACVVAVLLVAGTAEAADVSGKLTTLLAGRQDPRAGDTVNVIPLYELVTVEVAELGLPATDDARLVLQGWGRLQVGDDELKDNMADLGLLYLQTRTGGLQLRLGRQHLPHGLGRMAMIDGLDARFDAPLGISAEAFYGWTVHPELRHRTDNWQGGGRLAWNLAQIGKTGEIGLGYTQRRERGEVRRHEVGLDAYTYIAGLRLFGLAVGVPVEGGLDLLEARLAVSYRQSEKLTFTVDGERVAPALLVPLTSIFSVFADTPHDAFGADATYTPSRYWTVSADGSVMFLDSEYLGYRAGLRVTTYREPSHRSFIGAEARRLDESDNGYLRGRAFTGLQLLEPLRVTAELFGYKFDEKINDVDVSFIGQVSGIYDLTSSMRVAATVSAGRTPWAESQVEGMLRFAYGFDVDLSPEAAQ